MTTQRTCEETTGMIGEWYTHCGAPAVCIVQHRGRSEGPYAMCRADASHNVRHRDAEVVEWLDEDHSL